MTQLAYSPMAAFLAHFRLLSDVASGRPDAYPLSASDHEILDAIRQLMAALTPEERALLSADAVTSEGEPKSGERRRRCERAELKLRRLLQARGVLRG
jgi:hypothetical protein